MSDLHIAFENLTTDMRASADPTKAPKMAAYMKDNFAFLGLTSPERKALQKPFMAAARSAEPDDVLDVADLCWQGDEREFQYVGSDLLRARAKTFAKADIDRLHHYVVTKSWWDTIDALAAHPVGTLVHRFPELGQVMDMWVQDDNFWVVRTAILHQLRFRDAVDQERLFRYALSRADDTEFFIRKALGWALRSYGRDAPDEVCSFVHQHEARFSGLTRREALKHL